MRWPGFAGMVAFRHPDATRIAAATKVFSLAESLGGVESLIEVPQAMTHQSVEGSAAAVPADLVRLSCGIEDAGRPGRGPRAGDRRRRARLKPPAGGRLEREMGLRRHTRWMRRTALLATFDRPGRARRGLAGARRGGQGSPRGGQALGQARGQGLAAAAAQAAPEGGRAGRRRALRPRGRGGPGRRSRPQRRRREADPRRLPRRLAQLARRARRAGRGRRQGGRAARTASHCPRWTPPRPSSRSSRPATRSPARRTCGAAATASGWTRATTARAPCPSRSPPPACSPARWTPAG